MTGVSRVTQPFQISHAVRTHTGLVRDHNEDDSLVRPEWGLYVVADGMGGHAAGKVASEICVQSVQEFFESGTLDEGVYDAASSQLGRGAIELAYSLLLANRRIYEASTANPQYAGMGTTAVGVRISGEIAAISHAGDSRVYMLRGGRLRQLTLDHSLSNFLHSLGRETEAQLAEATMSNVIMRALGLEPEVMIDTQEVPLQHGDRLLLCSDGLSDLVSSVTIERVLCDLSLSRDDAADRLIDYALDAGGRDNVTVLLVDVVSPDGAADEAIAHRETMDFAAVSGEDSFEEREDTLTGIASESDRTQ